MSELQQEIKGYIIYSGSVHCGRYDISIGRERNNLHSQSQRDDAGFDPKHATPFELVLPPMNL